MEKEKCMVDGCSNAATVKLNQQSILKVCSGHYSQYRKRGVLEPFKFKGVNKRGPYNNMISRCYTPSSNNFFNYGGRGIKVCDRWLEPNDVGYNNFIEDMGPRPNGCSLDRIDVNKDYSPDNCRWATKYEQAANRRNSCKTVGVSYVSDRKLKWRAALKFNGVIYVEHFETEEEAIIHRKMLESKYLSNTM